jgi:hypothetical protein
MGDWGFKSFDNDAANDWAYGLDDVTDLSLVESAFQAVEESGDYLEAPDACNAIAACEVLAGLLGHPGYQDSYTEKVDAWVASHPTRPSDVLLARAQSVLDRILGEGSELLELWNEGDGSEWLGAVQDLRGRLKSS